MKRLQVLRGEITKIDVDVIVNAANELMLGGGGVDGAIHAAAGPELLAACRALPEVRPGVRCPTGEARLTPAYRLPARFVVHTVGPIWRGGTHGEPGLLASCYRSSLELAAATGASSIAFPSISTGAFSYPKRLAATVAVRECRAFLQRNSSFSRVLLVAFDDGDAEILRKVLSEAPG
jgi:O-acetyl-ADP-ribose deacetylase (regulator of RNase III)